MIPPCVPRPGISWCRGDRSGAGETGGAGQIDASGTNTFGVSHSWFTPLTTDRAGSDPIGAHAGLMDRCRMEAASHPSASSVILGSTYTQMHDTERR